MLRYHGLLAYIVQEKASSAILSTKSISISPTSERRVITRFEPSFTQFTRKQEGYERLQCSLQSQEKSLADRPEPQTGLLSTR
jgi:hypothetical protein